MKRVTELDTLRGLAALLIAVYHLRPQNEGLHWSRVDFFLVLSGYLVTSILLKHREAKGFLRTFYVRRFLRIWPAYLLTVLALVAINPVLSRPFPMDGLWNYLTFTQNIQYYWNAEPPPFNWYFLHTWSLSLEERFYVVWPVLVLLLGPRAVLPLAACLVVGSVTARSLGFHPWVMLARSDGLGLGAILAVVLADPGWVAQHRRRLTLGFGTVGLAGLATLAVVLPRFEGRPFDGPMTTVPALALLVLCVVYAAVVGLVVCHTGHRGMAVLRGRRLTYLGTISYGVYLLHPLVFLLVDQTCRRLGVGMTWWLDAMKIGLCLGLAALSWEVFERPIAALKHRFPYRHAPAREGAIPAPALARIARAQTG